MSRIGKQPVELPPKVKLSIAGNSVKVEGPLGTLNRVFRGVQFEQSGTHVNVKPVDDKPATRALWGLSRSMASATLPRWRGTC